MNVVCTFLKKVRFDPSWQSVFAKTFLKFACAPLIFSNRCAIIPYVLYGLVAQLGERTVRIREVRGFDPLRVHQNETTIFFLKMVVFIFPAFLFGKLPFSSHLKYTPILSKKPLAKKQAAFCRLYKSIIKSFFCALTNFIPRVNMGQKGEFV